MLTEVTSIGVTRRWSRSLGKWHHLRNDHHLTQWLSLLTSDDQMVEANDHVPNLFIGNSDIKNFSSNSRKKLRKNSSKWLDLKHCTCLKTKYFLTTDRRVLRVWKVNTGCSNRIYSIWLLFILMWLPLNTLYSTYMQTRNNLIYDATI